MKHERLRFPGKRGKEKKKVQTPMGPTSLLNRVGSSRWCDQMCDQQALAPSYYRQTKWPFRDTRSCRGIDDSSGHCGYKPQAVNALWNFHYLRQTRVKYAQGQKQ